MDSIKDPIEQLREHARKVSDMATEFSERGFSPLGFQLEAIANEIEAQYMRLPVDADGVPIRPGDRMERICAEEPYPFKAWFVGSTTDFLSDETDFYNASECRHAKPDTLEDAIKDMLKDMADERFLYISSSSDKHRMGEIVADCADRIRKTVDGPHKTHLWVSETEYNSLVDVAEECQKWRDECKKLGEQLDRLRRDDAGYKGIVVKTCELDVGKKDRGLA